MTRDTAAHYTWGRGCDGWHLVTAAGLSVIQERMPPGTSEQRHQHARSRQFFYVLSGELTVECDAVRHRLVEGSGVEVGPGTPHQVRNDSASVVEFLVVSQPPSHGDRTEP